MGVPATTGQLRAAIADMEIGDYIRAEMNPGGAISTIYALSIGTSNNSNEFPTTGIKRGTSFAGHFYLIKVARGLLVADRVVINQMTWDAMNSEGLVQGKPFDIGVIRSLTGGVAYADSNGNKANTFQFGGAWPTNNEWDRYVVGFPAELIQEGKTIDDVFHASNVWTITQDTPSNGITNPSGGTAADSKFRVQRVLRGHDFYFNGSNLVHSDLGFRPVFEYKEV